MCKEVVELVSKEGSDTSSLQHVQRFESTTSPYKYLQFLDGYYNFSVWRKYPKFSQAGVEQDKLNIVHWVLFFNHHKILEHILATNEMNLNLIFTGDHVDYEYEYKERAGEKKGD